MVNFTKEQSFLSPPFNEKKILNVLSFKIALEDEKTFALTSKAIAKYYNVIRYNFEKYIQQYIKINISYKK